MLSRVAEALYWMSRYIERAENNARLLDVNIQMMLDFEAGTGRSRAYWASIIASLEEQELFKKFHEEANAESVVEFVAFERKNPNSIYSCIARARENARTVREQISSEMWEEINSLYLFMHSDHSRRVFTNSAYEFFKKVVEGSQLFIGITDSTMTHAEGWEFLQAGKFIERADNTSRILDVKYHILLPQGEKVGGNVDTIQWMAVLKSCSALEAYRKCYVGQVTPAKVADFLILHGDFPRSIRFSVEQFDMALHRVSGIERTHYGNEGERLNGRLCSELSYSNTSDIFNVGLHQYLDRVQGRLIEIGKAVHEEYFAWEAPELQQLQHQSQG